jgi:hypothetical protein
MNKIKLLIIITAVIFGLLSFLQLQHSYAEIPEDSCPPITVDKKGWEKATNGGTREIKYYIFNARFTEGEKTQIRRAFELWSASSLLTCLKISFTETSVQSESKYLVLMPAKSDIETTQVVDSTTLFVLSAGTTIPLAQIDRTHASYPNFILKAMLHEIGHTMGLDHYYRIFR